MATNKQFHFDTFSGNDITIDLMFPYKDNSGKSYTVRVANITSISGSIQTEGTPRHVMGDPNPKAFSQGKRLINGAFMLETLNKSFIQEIQEIMPTDYFNVVEGISIGDLDSLKTVKDNVKLKYADQITEFDIIISAVKESDPSIRAERKLLGCKIYSETSGIGLSTLDSQEAFQFLAREITPFKKIEASQIK